MMSTDWEDVYALRDGEEAYNEFFDKFMVAYDANFPLSTVRVSTCEPLTMYQSLLYSQNATLCLCMISTLWFSCGPLKTETTYYYVLLLLLICDSL